MKELTLKDYIEQQEMELMRQPEIIVCKPKTFEAFLNLQIKKYKKGKRKLGQRWSIK